jgi:hypothetical protein
MDLVPAIKAAAISLEKHGYAVIPNVLTVAEVDACHVAFWRVMEAATGGRLKRPASAADLASFKKTNNWPTSKHGILEDGRWAHTPFVHDVRCHPRVVEVYTHLYGCNPDQLVVSPDRINYQHPAEWVSSSPKANPATPLTVRQHATWLHIDQALTKRGLYCLQGLVTLTDALQPGDASFECVPGSHLLHDDLEEILGRRFNKKESNRDWLMFTDEDKALLCKRLTMDGRSFDTLFASIRATKGSMILWDSRLMHQGGIVRACARTPRLEPSNPRFAIYTCMQPRSAWSPAQLEFKQTAFARRAATPHWPLADKKGTIFGKPRVYSADAPKLEELFKLDDHLEPAFDLTTERGARLHHMYGLDMPNDDDWEYYRTFSWAPLLDFASQSRFGASLRWPPERLSNPWTILPTPTADDNDEVATKKARTE